MATEYSATFWLNLAQPWTITRAADGTHTRIRGTEPYTNAGDVIELLVLETPEEIAALVQEAKSRVMTVVMLQVQETVEEILEHLA